MPPAVGALALSKALHGKQLLYIWYRGESDRYVQSRRDSWTLKVKRMWLSIAVLPTVTSVAVPLARLVEGGLIVEEVDGLSLHDWLHPSVVGQG